jgi:hypothetical protein
MSDEPKMTAFMVALNFQNGPLVLNAILAPSDYAAVAMVTAGSIQAMNIEQPLQGCAVMALTPEFLDAARQGGKSAAVVSLVQPEPGTPACAHQWEIVTDRTDPLNHEHVWQCRWCHERRPSGPSHAQSMIFGPDPEPPAA